MNIDDVAYNAYLERNKTKKVVRMKDFIEGFKAYHEMLYGGGNTSELLKILHEVSDKGLQPSQKATLCVMLYHGSGEMKHSIKNLLD
jgi:hypothetical protein